MKQVPSVEDEVFVARRRMLSPRLEVLSPDDLVAGAPHRNNRAPHGGLVFEAVALQAIDPRLNRGP